MRLISHTIVIALAAVLFVAVPANADARTKPLTVKTAHRAAAKYLAAPDVARHGFDVWTLLNPRQVPNGQGGTMTVGGPVIWVADPTIATASAFLLPHATRLSRRSVMFGVVYSGTTTTGEHRISGSSVRVTRANGKLRVRIVR